MAITKYIAEQDYTIADIAVFLQYGGLVKGWQYHATEFLSVQDYPNVQRLADTIFEWPAVKRGRMVNLTWGNYLNNYMSSMTQAISTYRHKT